MPLCALSLPQNPRFLRYFYHWIIDLTSIDRFSAGTLSTSPAPASAAWPGRPPRRRSSRSATSTGRGRRQSTSSTCPGDDEMNFKVKFCFYFSSLSIRLPGSASTASWTSTGGGTSTSATGYARWSRRRYVQKIQVGGDRIQMLAAEIQHPRRNSFEVRETG